MESNDSVEDRKELQRQESISNLRKEYQAQIRKSLDHGDAYPGFTLDEDEEIGEITQIQRRDSESHRGIKEIRKRQVEDLMLAVVDDGDYVAESAPTNRLGIDSALVRAQKSTQSTIVGSPGTPKDFSYSFEERLHDGQSEFDFDSPQSSARTENPKQNISIVIDENPDGAEQLLSRETNSNIHSRPNNGLSPLPLHHRSDSSNTLVSQGQSDLDLSFNHDNSNGDLSPRFDSLGSQNLDLGPIDALSESSESFISGGTTVRGLSPCCQDDLDKVAESKVEGHVRFSKQLTVPQESFELEEVFYNLISFSSYFVSLKIECLY